MKELAQVESEPRPGRRGTVTAGVVIGMFLAALEATAVSTAMPTVVASLGGLHIYSWVFSAYLLASTAPVPVWGKLSDLYGRKLFYLIGVALFLCGSVLSGLARSMHQLIAFRAIQGLGAGALFPLSLTILGDLYSLRERVKVQTLNGAVWGIASIIGPLAGGLISDRLSWRWVFYLVVPFGLSAGAIILFHLEEPKRKVARAAVDYQGALLLIATVTAFILVLLELGRGIEMRAGLAAGLLAASALLFWLFARVERRRPEPILPPSLFSNRLFTVASLSGFLTAMTFFGSISFVPLFIQGVMGTSATRAGSSLTPLILAFVVSAIVAGRLLLAVGYKPTVFGGMVTMSAGFALLARMGEHSSWGEIIWSMLLIGTGIGATMITLLLVVQSSVPRRVLGAATSATIFFRSIGGAIGVSIMGAGLSYSINTELGRLAARAGGAEKEQLLGHAGSIIDPLARSHVGPEAAAALRGALAAGLHYVFLLGLAISLCALAISLLLPADVASDEG